MAKEELSNRSTANIFRGLDLDLEDGEFCDVCVVVEEREFPCHRSVLASVSTYFRTALKAHWREGSTGRVVIEHEDVSPETFEMLLDILYRGKDMVNSETAKAILRMSVYLRIEFLENYCTKFLCKNLKPSCCLGNWQFAEQYDLDTLGEKSFQMALEKFSSVWQEEEFLALPKSMLLILLSKLRVDEDAVCKAIFRWMKADPDTRQKHLPELLPFVCFPRLSPGYLCELFACLDPEQNHPPRKILFEKVQEGLTYKLKGVQGNDASVRARILARQSVRLSSEETKISVVMFGGCEEADKPTRSLYAFDIDSCAVERYALSPIPEDIGIDFASCTWSNEIFVSGGSQLPTFFAVFQPGDNKWEVLPPLPGGGREKHAMAAVSSEIFVLGGLEESSGSKKEKKVVSSSILKYSLRAKAWHVFGELPAGVQQSTAAVLGERIYLFGGVDADGEVTDAAQCVDTLSGCAYQAGRLPSPTCGARALSDGGHIYVVRVGGDVLLVSETIFCCVAEEKAGRQRDTEKNVDGDCCAAPTPRSKVGFKDVGRFVGRSHFSAYLHEGEITVCGGLSKERDLMCRCEGITLKDGTSSKKPISLVAAAAMFDLHVLNLPLVYLNKDTVKRQPYRVGDIVIIRPEEHENWQECRSYGHRQTEQSKLPFGTGTITCLGEDGTQVEVKFPECHRWSGKLSQLQHSALPQ